ncbi:unnamed protein product [Owenia fusiformis]|uniref:VWFA domain-containing protein n=1 Tax=Owenia fusiformis TaxID=6347 RepID=A0A8S4NG90_OWEFU|nr:unnamed protein product [Owenia fusiformis]
MVLFFLFIFNVLVATYIPKVDCVNVDDIRGLFPIIDSSIARRIMQLMRGELQLERSGSSLVNVLPSAFESRTCGPASDPASMNVDLCVIIQTTCHITDGELEAARNIIVQTAERFGTDVSLSIVGYSDKPKVLVEFQENGGILLERMRKMRLRRRIQRCRDCEAATGDALRTCREILIHQGRDNRYFPDAIMIFTDGVSMKSKFTMNEDRAETIVEALLNKREGIITIVSTFNNSAGRHSGFDEWHALNSPSNMDGVTQLDPFPATDPNAHVYTRSLVFNDEPSFSLDETLTAMHVRSFKKQIYTAIPGCSDPCNQFADIVIIIDRSESIAVSDLQIVLDFFIFLLGESLIEPDTGLQFAIYSYNGEIYKHSTVGQYTTKEELIRVVKSIPLETAKYTDTGIAINQAMTDLLVNGREESRKTIIIATDGRAWRPRAKRADSTLAIRAAKIAAAREVEIYIIGLPSRYGHMDGMTEWSQLASEPIECTIVNMQRPNATFDDLYLAGIMLTNELCKKGADSSVCTFQNNDFD